MSKLEMHSFASVWDALEDTPEAAENMKMRSELMRSLAGFIKSSGLTQAQAARLLGVTQPRVSDLMRGKISLFGLEALVSMAARAGFRVQVQLQSADEVSLPYPASSATSASTASTAQAAA